MHPYNTVSKRKRGSPSLVAIVQQVEKRERELNDPIRTPEKQFYERFDPMNPDHMDWFKKFSRQAVYPHFYQAYLNTTTDFFIENPFNIQVEPRQFIFAHKIVYLLSVKHTMNQFNIPL